MLVPPGWYLNSPGLTYSSRVDFDGGDFQEIYGDIVLPAK